MAGLTALLDSRKFWAGTFSVLGIFVALYLRAKDLIPPDALVPTITGIAGLGGVFIGATGLEDASKKLFPPREPDKDTDTAADSPAPAALTADAVKNMLTTGLADLQVQNAKEFANALAKVTAHAETFPVPPTPTAEAIAPPLDDAKSG